MNTSLRLNMMQPSVARLVRNLAIRDESYLARPGTKVLGAAADEFLLYATDIARLNGTRKLVRIHLEGVDVLTGSAWVAAVGAALGLAESDVISTVGWADTLLFTYGRDGLWEIDLAADTYALLANTPTEAIHLTAFGVRVVASQRDGIYWSVRADSTDWLGIGSGFEDLRSAPGGVQDQQTAVIPVTDDTALAIRTDSVWMMRTTGDFDAPFGFTLLRSRVGGEWPQACCAVPGGAAFVSRDSVIVMTGGGEINDVGVPIRRTLFQSRDLQRRMHLIYESGENELRLSVPDGTTLGKVYRVALSGGRWTEDVYPFAVQSLAITRFQNVLTIDELPSDPIDSLTGSMDSLGIEGQLPGTIYAMQGAPKLVTRDRTDLDTDDNTLGVATPRSFRYETGYVMPGTTLDASMVLQVMIEYECSFAVVLDMEYSTDGGVTWAPYASIDLPATQGSTIRESYAVITAPHIMIALTSDDAKDLRILGVPIRLTVPEEIENAR
jgi:hypothetical protein